MDIKIHKLCRDVYIVAHFVIIWHDYVQYRDNIFVIHSTQKTQFSENPFCIVLVFERSLYLLYSDLSSHESSCINPSKDDKHLLLSFCPSLQQRCRRRPVCRKKRKKNLFTTCLIVVNSPYPPERLFMYRFVARSNLKTLFINVERHYCNAFVTQ